MFMFELSTICWWQPNPTISCTAGGQPPTVQRSWTMCRMPCWGPFLSHCPKAASATHSCSQQSAPVQVGQMTKRGSNGACQGGTEWVWHQSCMPNAVASFKKNKTPPSPYSLFGHTWPKWQVDTWEGPQAKAAKKWKIYLLTSFKLSDFPPLTRAFSWAYVGTAAHYSMARDRIGLGHNILFLSQEILHWAASLLKQITQFLSIAFMVWGFCDCI